MKTYDAIIIGAGGGTKLRPLADMGKKIAIVEREDPGGTCLNRGCIPSKMLIHAADVADTIRDSHRFNLAVDTDIDVHFEDMVTRVTNEVTSTSRKVKEMYEKHENIDFYNVEGRFVDNKTIEVDGDRITAERIFIAAGARPAIPSIEGLEGTPYMTSREALRNTRLPKKMIIIGGGYIAVELGHFYGALGTEVHFIARSGLLKQLDSEIGQEFCRVFREKYPVHLAMTPTKVRYHNGLFTLTMRDAGGREESLDADALLVATGITPNSDTLQLQKTDIETDNKGFIAVNEYLETAVPGVYALGDVVGNYFFRHSVNFEGEYLLENLYQGKTSMPINYPPVPYAVFTGPQVAGVGKTEEDLQKEGIVYIKGVNHYKHSAMGDALRSEHGMVKLLFDQESHALLGAHIIGPEASDMIHMCIAYLNMNAKLEDMLRTIYIHPALPENIRNAARKAKASID